MTESTPEPGEAASGGGRTTRGPAVRPGGEAEPGGLTPPYEGRRERADVDDEGPPGADADVRGATGPVRTDQGPTRDPAATPGGSTGAPGDEQPASELADNPPDEEGTGPAHYPGTPRGEEMGGRGAAADDRNAEPE